MWWPLTTSDAATPWLAIALLVVTVPACGGSNAPAAPTSPSPTPSVVTAPVTDLTITGPALVPTGSTVKAEVVNLFREDGVLLRTSTIPEEYYFPPNSEFVEDLCTDLEESTSGFYEDVVHGIDDKGTELTFRRRLRLLAVAGASPTSSRISPGPIATRGVARALRRVR